MGTHISRVKSVDLDTWNDEQMQSMLRWGNARANKYWEAKLAEGHVPNESKIENFIRTKYESKRWVMEGPMPDPSTLDVAGDDDVPLSVVRDKVVGERERSLSGHVRNGSGMLQQPPAAGPRVRPQDVDLFGDEGGSMAPARPNTTEPAVPRQGLQKAPVAPPKQTKPGESLLGLDFFGGSQSAPPARPSSTGATTPGVPGRADLKSSILSLYASKPAAVPQSQPQQQPQSNANMFGGMQSPPIASPTQPQSNASVFGGMNDAFGSMSFTSPQQSQAKQTPFSNFSPPAGQARQPSANKSSLSGGSFFDSKPAPPAKPTPQPRKESFGGDFGGDFGDFSSAASPPLPTAAPMRSPPAATSNMSNLFDMPSPTAAPPKPNVSSLQPVQAQQQQPKQPSYSAFNLSQPTPQPTQPSPPQAQTSTLSSFASLNNADPWGSNDAWATAEPAPRAQPAPPQASVSNFSKPLAPAPAPAMQTAFDSGWGDVVSPAKPAAAAPSMNTNTATSAGGFSVQQDEEFGGWSHASPVAQTPGAGPKQGGGFGSGSDDLFGNVWE